MPNFNANMREWTDHDVPDLRDATQLAWLPRRFSPLRSCPLPKMEHLRHCTLGRDADPIHDLTPLTYCQSVKFHCMSFTEMTCTLEPLGNAQKVNFEYIPDDVPAQAMSYLRSCRELTIGCCPALSDLTEIGQLPLRALKLCSCTALEDLAPLGRLTDLATLTLDTCEAITDLSALGRLKSLRRLELRRMHVANLAGISNIQKINLFVCENLTVVPNLGQVDTLSITGCRKLRRIAASDRIRDLRLEHCDELEDVAELASTAISRLRVTHCGKITDAAFLERARSRGRPPPVRS